MHLLGLVALCPVRAEEPIRYVVAPAITLADPFPFEFQNPQAQESLGRQFREAFEGRFGRVVPLSATPEGMITASQPTLLVVPRLSVVRLYKDTVAGSLDHLEATLVGDVTLVDPWSLTSLFAATRMVTTTVSISRDKDPRERAELIRKAFGMAATQWIQECLGQLQTQAHPFSLKAALLPLPKGVRIRGGAIWPFGSQRSVSGRILQGAGSGRVRIKQVFERFSLVEQAIPGRDLDLGAAEVYGATFMGQATPAERKEPRLSLRWIGPARPSPQLDSQVPPLAMDAWLGLMANYVSKAGAFRVLPVAETQLDKGFQADVGRFSQQVEGNAFTASLEDLAAKAKLDSPEVEVEIGVVDAHHATRVEAGGATDHLLRVVWGLAWYQRESEDGEPGRLILRGTEFQTEEKVFRMKEGLRELDLDSIWFSLCRNGLINLSGRFQKAWLVRPKHGQHAHKGVVQAEGKVQWLGLSPKPGTKLAWIHPEGAIRDAQGRDLGPYFQPNSSLVWPDLGRASQGDELSFRAGGLPTVGLLIPDVPETIALLPARWIQAALAAQLSRAAGLDIVLQDRPGEATQCESDLRLKVDTPFLDPSRGVGATWRLRVYRDGYTPEKEPRWKLGLGHALPYPPTDGYRPLDATHLGLVLQESSLTELIKRSTQQGLIQAITLEK
ncbi:MAG: hypothetical protein HXX12_13035 [Geothrix sp.]|uniref:hypothetical protein n=1 Tax=Geothrix sp. TaxID=1962974 RepID=UPI0017EB590C|nr:hypothetical protein [Geothrix sp.]NWJ41881.1 hypothetical protein [Geothrix sp.]WIL20146.1 MAG: hypothetical protein QOZ81_002692 [Geothrix sp.]